MILTRDPIEGFPGTKATFLYHSVEKINLFAIRWASPDSNPKLQDDANQVARIKAVLRKIATATTSTRLQSNILKSNEIEKSRNDYMEMERALLRSMKL